MDAQSIRAILDAAGLDESKVILAEFERQECEHERKVIKLKEPWCIPIDCPVSELKIGKDQEKLSMFYAGKKRRKGGRYA